MKKSPLSTDPYKGVRDFYPEDAAVSQYIFSTWSNTAERFGFVRYDASILEPAELYKAKGAQNEELVNEQTYTFTDRGDREVTLRPEMTPTVARMVAKKQKELAFPLRWYSIPNLFRYERPQKGRLREHWQLNCDIFGSTDFTTDVEIILLAYQVLLDFGATPDMFKIRINDRALMTRLYKAIGVDEAHIPAITRLNDRKDKIDDKSYRQQLKEIVGDGLLVEQILLMFEKSDEQSDVVLALQELGITNVVFDKTLARGFDYYTGTVFEFFDVSGENNRALLGGGRYDDLTAMFGGESVPGVGFGMGDVTMRDFLMTHGLLPQTLVRVPEIMVLPMGAAQNLYAQKIAMQLRATGAGVSVDSSSKKIGKKIGDAATSGVAKVVVVGETEAETGSYTIKDLASGEETSKTLV